METNSREHDKKGNRNMTNRNKYYDEQQYDEVKT